MPAENRAALPVGFFRRLFAAQIVSVHAASTAFRKTAWCVRSECPSGESPAGRLRSESLNRILRSAEYPKRSRHFPRVRSPEKELRRNRDNKATEVNLLSMKTLHANLAKWRRAMLVSTTSMLGDYGTAGWSELS